MEEREAGEDDRHQEIDLQLIGEEEAHGKIESKTDCHHFFLSAGQHEEQGPQLCDQHCDQGGVSPAPAVDRIGKAVGEIAESGDEQERRVQEKLKAQLDKALCAKEQEYAQERGPRVAQSAVLHFIAGKEIQRLIAGLRATRLLPRTVMAIGSRIAPPMATPTVPAANMTPISAKRRLNCPLAMGK